MNEIARLVVNGWPSTNNKTLERWLFRTITKLKNEGKRTNFLITPGGFALGAFPDNWDNPRGWNSSDDLSQLIACATPLVDQIVSMRVVKAARHVVRYLTLNVDLRTLNSPLHAELIAVIDLRQSIIVNRSSTILKIVGWTGKSYPTMNQENNLIHVTDPKTHLFELGNDRVIILGCHDLNVFNGRALANQKHGGNRHRRSQSMLKVFTKFKPTHIIQHPHGTDTWRSWNQSWNKVSRLYPNAHWASAIAYAVKQGPKRAPLKDVLARTHSEGKNSTNVIIRGNKERSLLQRAYLPPIAAR
jgi:hypothetical protein